MLPPSNGKKNNLFIFYEGNPRHEPSWNPILSSILARLKIHIYILCRLCFYPEALFGRFCWSPTVTVPLFDITSSVVPRDGTKRPSGGTRQLLEGPWEFLYLKGRPMVLGCDQLHAPHRVPHREGVGPCIPPENEGFSNRNLIFKGNMFRFYC